MDSRHHRRPVQPAAPFGSRRPRRPLRPPPAAPAGKQVEPVEPLEPRVLLSTVVTSVRINGGAAQRSTVLSVGLQFNANVSASLSGSDLLLYNRDTGKSVNTAVAARVGYDAQTNTATWAFPALPGRSLPNGNYRATLKSMGVHDAVGNPLDGNADGRGGDEYSFDLARRYGDNDGDGDVDATDSRALRATFNKSVGRPGYNGAFDYDGDNDVDGADRHVFRYYQPPTAAGNRPPAAPLIDEPTADGQVVNSQDVHMQIGEAFADPDAGQQRTRTDWEIWTRGGGAPQRVWAGLGKTHPESQVHVHFGDGVFEGPQDGQNRLAPGTDYLLRARVYDDSGDAGTAASNWDVRYFRTRADEVPTAPGWVARQPGFRVEEVPFTFPAGEQGWRLPTNIAFVPQVRRGPHPADPLFYVMELYGSIRVVTNDFTVHTYATGLLNYNPSGPIAGTGENGATGLAVDPASGDVFASMLYDDPADATADTFPKVTRFTAAAGTGGLRALDTDPARPGTQGTDILKMPGEPMRQSHIVSNVSFGPADGRLYVHVGDGFQASRGQNDFRFSGKILRMNPDGSPVTDNPAYDPADRGGDGRPDAEDYWFAKGLRNPFGGGWRDADPAAGRPEPQHYTVENGPSLDRLSMLVRGRNYLYDGSDTSMRNFNLAYSPSGAFENGADDWQPSPAPVNIAFVQNSADGGSRFPASKLGHAFVTLSGSTHASGPNAAKSIQEWVFNNAGNRAAPTAGGQNPRELVSYEGAGYSTAAALAAGPEGLYFSTLYPDTDPNATNPGAKILRVVYTGGTADFTTDRTAVRGGGGGAPLTVRFTDASAVPGAAGYLWDFGDGATSTLRNPAHTYAAGGTYTVTLTVTGGPDGPVTVRKDNLIRVGGGDAGRQAVRINFQPAGAPVPAGYSPDTGGGYGSRGNGLTYGWFDPATDDPVDNAANARDRNSAAAAADQRHDTLIHMQRAVGGQTSFAWGIGLPDGRYRVRAVFGDPSNADSNNAVTIEGQRRDDPDGLDAFDEYTADVGLTDGRLTVRPVTGGYAKICFIEITPVPAAADGARAQRAGRSVGG